MIHFTITVRERNGWRWECTCGEHGPNMRKRSLAELYAESHLRGCETVGGIVRRPA